MIEVKKLSKIYSNGKGIFEINFKVPEGEAFGFLGPNGAGKTTTIRNLLGFTNPTSGSCSINGLDCRKSAAEIQKTLGYVPGEISFFDNMTGMQFMKFIADMRGINDTKRRDSLIERFELESHRKIRKMSKGMKQKLGLITALMHDPSVIILDEPTSGLDPLMQKRFIELIIEEKQRGKTILMSSHIFDEVDRTCERVAIIREGRIVAIEDINSIKSSLRKSYVVTVASNSDIEKIKTSNLDYQVIDDNAVEIFISNNYNDMLSTLASCKVTNLDVSTQTLEQIFIQYYGKGEE
ncbi:Bacitracin transport ATP-binding protein bcrA [Proteiniborus sp. DW1]|uniref:ABC transporter ATP-binding protein n=1 Tax=Proteiniborus sp. DW1 TaxID=1889883 RepID=UPI00092E135E|nr:ABC transporter ATP-binding protein [Proteiniborus sp. DW1]SCG81679.1 Bacitracin transport ATP-binding protein bcrA [Proteiniborus sp. DW1]